jgi:hypothetical protein
MATIADRRSDGIGAGAGRAARRGLWGVARLVSLAVSIVVGLLLLGIVLVLLEANRDNAIVDWLLGAGEFLAEPFDNVFDMDGKKASVGVNWGLAALVYAAVGGLVVRLLRR